MMLGDVAVGVYFSHEGMMIIFSLRNLFSREFCFNSVTSQAWSSLHSGGYGKLEVVLRQYSGNSSSGNILVILVHVVLTSVFLCSNRTLQLFAGLLCCLKLIGRKEIAPNSTFAEAIYFVVSNV